MKKIIAFLATLAFISPVVASAAPYIVNQGGTGASTFTAGQLLVGNGKNPITGTSSPTVASINTSSTTATSTFAGNAYVKGNLQVDGNFFAPVSLVSSGNATINGILTVTGVSKFSDGAVGTPSLSFTNDTNTGIYRLGNDILSLVTGGADRLTINASGNVGIGTTTPLHMLSVTNPSGSGSNLYVAQFTSNAGANVPLVAYSDASGSAIVNQTGSLTGAEYIYLSQSGNMTFNTAGSEWMRINSTGNVGIGTTNPSQKLEINGGMRLNTATAKPTCDSTVRGTFWFTQSGAGVKDAVEVCAKDAADAYAWRTIY